MLSLVLAAGVACVALLDRSPVLRVTERGDAPAAAPVFEIFSRPDPQETVMAFFDALELQDYEKFYSLLDGYASLGLEERPEDSAGRMVLGALRDSYSYRLEGEARISGDTAEQDVYLRSLDLSALEQALRETAREKLEQRAAGLSFKERCDENGYYQPWLVEEACSAATTELLGRIQDFYADHTLTLSLLYSEGWHVRGDEALVSAILGTA